MSRTVEILQYLKDVFGRTNTQEIQEGYSQLYLLDKSGGQNILLRCHYERKFLAEIHLPQFFKEIH